MAATVSEPPLVPWGDGNTTGVGVGAGVAVGGAGVGVGGSVAVGVGVGAAWHAASKHSKAASAAK